MTSHALLNSLNLVSYHARLKLALRLASSPLAPRLLGLSPAIQDENTYTPLHAAASWGHAEILRYLVAKGGNINTVDGDGETPLFVVETTEMARIVLDLGGDIAHRNEEGNTVSAQGSDS